VYTTRFLYSEDMRVLSSTNMYSSKQIQISPYLHWLKVLLSSIYHTHRYVCFISWPTPRNWQWCRLGTKLYDKRDDFNFLIVNFPFICSNIPATPAYVVYISQLIRYSRACGSYQDYLDRGLLQRRKLLNQGFLLVKLKSSLRRFYGRLHDMADRDGISMSQMTTDIFYLS
jgi:hypothetical protein